MTMRRWKASGVVSKTSLYIIAATKPELEQKLLSKNTLKYFIPAKDAIPVLDM